MHALDRSLNHARRRDFEQSHLGISRPEGRQQSRSNFQHVGSRLSPNDEVSSIGQQVGVGIFRDQVGDGLVPAWSFANDGPPVGRQFVPVWGRFAFWERVDDAGDLDG